jgi:hypothetical protein
MKTILVIFLVAIANVLMATDSIVVRFKYNSDVVPTINIPNGKVTRIEGHTCKIGDANYNLDLAKRRAVNTLNTLISMGAEMNDSVVVVSYGEERATTYTSVDRKVVIYYISNKLENVTGSVETAGNTDNVETTNTQSTNNEILAEMDSINSKPLDLPVVVANVTVNFEDRVLDNPPAEEQVTFCDCGDITTYDKNTARYFNALGARANSVEEDICAPYCYAKARMLQVGYADEKVNKALDVMRRNIQRAELKASRKAKHQAKVKTKVKAQRKAKTKVKTKAGGQKRKINVNKSISNSIRGAKRWINMTLGTCIK